MDIIKSLRDYPLNYKQRVFAGYLKENAGSYSCNEKITNKAYIRKYFSPQNDFLIYTTAVADPVMLLTKKAV